MTELLIKRAYEPAAPADGFRVYVDRLWPRGLSHLTFPYDLWAKQIAPSDELRHWFHSDTDARWEDFEAKYRAELAANPALPAFISTLSSHPVVTLLYSSHNEAENNALVLADTIRSTSPSAFK